MTAHSAYYSSKMDSMSTTSLSSSTASGGSGSSSLSASRVIGPTKYDLSDLITLPSEKQHQILDKANDTIAYVLKSMLTDRKSIVNWKPKMEKHGVSYYVDETVLANQFRFCCMAEMNASVEDVMKLFLMTDTDTLLKNYRVMYNNVLDARILSVISYPTNKNPYKSVYVRYASFQTPKLMDNRDMCVAVATDVFTHMDGSTIGYCLWDSVDIPECPDYSKSHGLVRSRMFRSGFVLRSSVDEHNVPSTKIVYLVGLEAGGIAPRLATKRVMDKFGANLARICDHFRRKHIDPKTFTPRGEWTPKSDAKYCSACIKRFSSLSKKKHCVACGEVVCTSCYTRQNVDLPGAGITSMRFCFQCLDARGIDCHRSDTPKTTVSSRESRRRPLQSPMSVDERF